MKLSLILPTYDEASNLPVLLERLEQTLKSVDHEIIVVDDDSPDGTWRVAQEWASRYPHIRVIRRITDKGLSGAIIEGFRVASGDVFGVMDADLSHDEAILPNLIQEIEKGADMVVGSRRIPGGGVDHWPRMRRLTSTVATKMVHLFLGKAIQDPMSGYFLVKKSHYEKVRSRLHPRGYKILLELICKGQPCKVVEIPFVFRDRRQGYSKLTVSVIIALLESLWEIRFGSSPLDRLRERYHRGRYVKVRKWVQTGKILDIGCGRPCEAMPDGAFLKELIHQEGVGLDVKPCRLTVPFARGDVAAIPYRDESFDGVVAMEILEHVHHLPQVLQEIRRVLKPGNCLVMSTPDNNLLWRFIWFFWTRWIGRMWKDEHHTNLTKKRWRQEISQYFQVKEIKRHWFFNLILVAEKN